MNKQPELIPKETRIANFSGDRKYRYTLLIEWEPGARRCQFIGLNPSTADEYSDDPTIRRCKGFAKAWGFGGMIMTNIFALRETDAEKMKKHPHPMGEYYGMQFAPYRNDQEIMGAAQQCEIVIACWGLDGGHRDRGRDVQSMLHAVGQKLFCIRKTKEGFPEHPLYLPKTLIPIRYA